MKGTIYVYSYPTTLKYKQLFKIGLTSRNAKTRIAEQQGTATPEAPIKFLEYQVDVNSQRDLEKLEKDIHNVFKLKDKWSRESGAREWFGPTNISEINDVINDVISKSNQVSTSRKEFIQYIPQKCQIEGEPAIREALKTQDKVQAICATGTGKTILSYALVRNTNKTVLFLCPTIALVNQTKDEWCKFQDINSLIVCSNKDSEDVDTIVSTDPTVIDAFLSSKIESKLNVVFGTYHSAEAISLAQASSNTEFDIVFYDEAHQTVTHADGRNHQAVLDCFIKSKKKVFVTATRKITNHDGGVNVATMNDVEKYGEVAYELTVAEAIQKGWSVPFQTYMMEVSQNSYNEVVEEIIDNTTISYDNDLMKARHVSSLVCLLKSINKLGSKKIATFHTTNSSALKFAELISELKVKGLLETDVLTRELTANNTQEFRKNFLATEFCNAETAVIASAKWMREGVDIPCLDTIIIVDPIGSGIACVQTIGRALRIDKNNPDKVAKIIIPSFIGDDFDTSKDNTVLTVISNLHDIDESANFEFDVVSPNGERVMRNTTFRVMQDVEIPDSRRIELNEYIETIQLRALGLYKQVKREERIEEFMGALESFSF